MVACFQSLWWAPVHAHMLKRSTANPWSLFMHMFMRVRCAGA